VTYISSSRGVTMSERKKQQWNRTRSRHQGRRICACGVPNVLVAGRASERAKHRQTPASTAPHRTARHTSMIRSKDNFLLVLEPSSILPQPPDFFTYLQQQSRLLLINRQSDKHLQAQQTNCALRRLESAPLKNKRTLPTPQYSRNQIFIDQARCICIRPVSTLSQFPIRRSCINHVYCVNLQRSTISPTVETRL